MRKAIHYFLILGCLGYSLTVMTGCVPLIVGAAAGASGVTYVRGKLERNVDHDVKHVHGATLKALKDIEVYVKTDVMGLHDAKITAEFADGKKVTINILALTERASKIRIRVGMIGDEMKSNVILNAIQKRL